MQSLTFWFFLRGNAIPDTNLHVEGHRSVRARTVCTSYVQEGERWRILAWALEAAGSMGELFLVAAGFYFLTPKTISQLSPFLDCEQDAGTTCPGGPEAAPQPGSAPWGGVGTMQLSARKRMGWLGLSRSGRGLSIQKAQMQADIMS